MICWKKIKVKQGQTQVSILALFIERRQDIASLHRKPSKFLHCPSVEIHTPQPGIQPSLPNGPATLVGRILSFSVTHRPALCWKYEPLPEMHQLSFFHIFALFFSFFLAWNAISTPYFLQKSKKSTTITENLPSYIKIF